VASLFTKKAFFLHLSLIFEDFVTWQTVCN